VLALVLVLAATAGCGTTVQGAALSDRAVGNGSEAGLSDPGRDLGSVGRSPSFQTRPTVGPQATASPGSDDSGASSASSSRMAAPARPLAGRGFTATRLLLGFINESDDAGVGASLGVASLSGGNHVAEIKAVVAHLNSTGGILGRTVVPVVHTVRTSEEQADLATASEAACRSLTEDHEVFAVISPIAAAVNNQVLFSCLSRHHTPVLASDLAPQSQATYAANAPYAFGPHSLSIERLAESLVARLDAQHFFSGWDTATGAPGTAPPVVGVVYIDRDRPFLDTITRSLGAAGYHSVQSFAYKPSLSSISSDMASAVLRFRSNNVTHVLVEEGSALLFFAQASDGQRFYPRYGLSSLDAPNALLATGALPVSQLRGALGAGYLPLVDVGPDAHDPSTATEACRKIMRDAGQTTTDPTAFVFMTFECDSVALLARALTSQGQISPQALRDGLTRLGSGFTSAAVPGMTWNPTRYDAVSAVRDFRFDGNKFQYNGPLHEV